jgi:hypothetical protein
MLDLNKKRTLQELKSLLDSIKVSDLPTSEKDRLIDEIQYKIDGRKYQNGEVLKDIEASMPDYSDIN